MKTEMTTTPVSVAVSHSQSDTTKLASLLALAAGAVAMPQSSQADIIYTDLNSNPAQVGFLGGSNTFNLTLPGGAKFGFKRFEQTVTTTITTQLFRGVVATDLFGTATVQIQFAQQG